MKFEPLHLHHVVFRSLGGSDEASNLVPICPTCHAMLHDGRRIGEEFVTDQELKTLWALWKRFREAVPALQRVGADEPTIRTRVFMDVYGLDTEFDVDGSIRYADARTLILQKTIGVLSIIDPHFPFAHGVIEPVQWDLSSDQFAQAGQWKTQVAAEVLGASEQPLRLQARPVFALTENASWVFGTRAQHRGL